jgi:hypothetical protein
MTGTGGTAASGRYALARAIRTIGAVIAGIIVLGILLRVLDANAGNAIVGAVLDVGNFFVAPFRGLFTPKDVDLRVVVNWGIAAVVYFAIASLIARLLAR